MSEINTPRLMAAAKEFNIGTSTLTDFLVSKGFETSDLKPTSKISEDMYRVLQVEFQPDKVAKQKAEQIDLPKNAPADNKKRRDEQDLSFNKKEAVKEKEEKVHAVEEPVPVGPVHQLSRLALPPRVDEHGDLYGVVVVRVVGSELEVPLQLPRIHVERHDAVREEVVAPPLSGVVIRAGIAGPPVGEVERGVV